jgi:hypothetical protein
MNHPHVSTALGGSLFGHKDAAAKRLEKAIKALDNVSGDLRPDAELELVDAIAVAEEWSCLGRRGRHE